MHVLLQVLLLSESCMLFDEKSVLWRSVIPCVRSIHTV